MRSQRVFMEEFSAMDQVIVQSTITIAFWLLLGMFIGYLLGRSRGYIKGRRERDAGDVWLDWKRKHPDEGKFPGSH